ncbi:MAG TPA: type II secretion system protein G [Thermoanaerobaculia bacterium]
MRRRAAATVLLLLACAACRKAEEKPRPDLALRETLAVMRTAIERFQREQGRYPHSLEELVPKYLVRIPTDPITTSAKTWRVVTEETVQPNADFTTAASTTAAATAPRPVIIDVRSGAGAPYSTY